jgi:flagellum-specific ATP synthase
MIDIVDEEHRRLAGKVVNILATYKKAEDLINIGAYVHGSNLEIDYAITMIDRINRFLMQDINEKIDFQKSKAELRALFAPEAARQ